MKDLEDRFAEIERRVRSLVAENRAFAARINELERELAGARQESHTNEHFHETRMRLREKLENILRALESVGMRK